MSTFSVYLIIYYSKYFKGNFFINYSAQGFSDCVTMVYVNYLSKKYQNSPNGLSKLLKFLVISLVLLCCVQLFITHSGLISDQILTFIVPINIMLMRLNCTSVQNFSYHVNQILYPVLIRGKAFAYTTFASRPFGGLSIVLTEYTDKPMVFVLVYAASSLLVINKFKEYEGKA